MLSTSTHPAFVGFIVSALVIFLSGFHLLRTATSELSWGQLCTWVSHVHLYPTLRVICRARQRTLLTLPIFNVHKPSTKKIFGCTSLLLIGDFIGLKFPHLSEKAQGTTWRKRDTLPERHVVSGVWKWLEDLSASRHTDTQILLTVGILYWQAVFRDTRIFVSPSVVGSSLSGQVQIIPTSYRALNLCFLHPFSDVLYPRNCILFEGRAMSLFVPLSGRTFARAAVTAASINVASSSVSSLGVDVTIYPEFKRYFSRRRAKDKMASMFSLFWSLFASSEFMIFYRERSSSTRCDG